MKFVVVNGRMPFRPTFCVWCCTPIYAGYLRDIHARLCYCSYQCYRLYGENSTVLLATEHREKRTAHLNGGA
jgi:hypothetical protein